MTASSGIPTTAKCFVMPCDKAQRSSEARYLDVLVSRALLGMALKEPQGSSLLVLPKCPAHTNLSHNRSPTAFHVLPITEAFHMVIKGRSEAVLAVSLNDSPYCGALSLRPTS